MKTISFIEKLPFRPYLLCSKPVKPGHYSVLPSHIFAFSRPNMVKWHHSGIIIISNFPVLIIIGNLQYSVLFKWSNFVADGHKDTISSWRGWKEFKADISGIGTLSEQKILINTFDTKLSKRDITASFQSGTGVSISSEVGRRPY